MLKYAHCQRQIAFLKIGQMAKKGLLLCISLLFLGQIESSRMADDIILVAGGKHFAVFRDVLMQSSPYFKSMFSGNYLESRQKSIDLSTSFTLPDVLECLIHYMYTGDLFLGDQAYSHATNNPPGLFKIPPSICGGYDGPLRISQQYFEELLNGASLFLLTTVVDICFDILLYNLNLSNCLHTWALAYRYHGPQLIEVCRQITAARFYDTMIVAPETLDVPIDFLQVILDDENIMTNVRPQNLSKFIRKWLNHDAERKAYASKLLSLTLVKYNLKKCATDKEQKRAQEVFGKAADSRLFKFSKALEEGNGASLEVIVINGENASFAYVPALNDWYLILPAWRETSEHIYHSDEFLVRHHNIKQGKSYKEYFSYDEDTGEWHIVDPNSDVIRQDEVISDYKITMRSTITDGIVMARDSLFYPEPEKGYPRLFCMKGFIYYPDRSSLAEFTFPLPMEREFCRDFICLGNHFILSSLIVTVKDPRMALLRAEEIGLRISVPDPESDMWKTVQEEPFVDYTNERIRGDEVLDFYKVEHQVIVKENVAYIFIQSKHACYDGNTDDEDDDDEEEEEEDEEKEEGYITVNMFELKEVDNKLSLSKVKEERLEQHKFMGHYMFVGFENEVYALMVSRYNPEGVGSTVQVISVKLFYSNADGPDTDYAEFTNLNGFFPPREIPLCLEEEKSRVIASAEDGKLYQLRSVSPLVTELVAYDVKTKSWSALKPPPLQIVNSYESATMKRLNRHMLKYLDASCFLYEEKQFEGCFEKQKLLRSKERKSGSAEKDNTECIDCKISSFRQERVENEDDDDMSDDEFLLWTMAFDLL